MKRLNQKQLGAINHMLRCAFHWHMIYKMQDDQDLDPGFRRRCLQERKRWADALYYYQNIILPRAMGKDRK